MQYFLPELRNIIEKELLDYIVSKDIMNAGGRENNNHFQIRKKEEWGTGLYDFHYEIQQNKKDSNVFYIRIDCHFNPYDEGKNRSRDEYERIYGAENVRQRIDLMKNLADKLQVSFVPIRRQKWIYNSIWILKWDLSLFATKEDVVIFIKQIIRETVDAIDNQVNLNNQ